MKESEKNPEQGRKNRFIPALAGGRPKDRACQHKVNQTILSRVYHHFTTDVGFNIHVTVQ
jgi:hypothetical protein